MMNRVPHNVSISALAGSDRSRKKPTSRCEPKIKNKEIYYWLDVILEVEYDQKRKELYDERVKKLKRNKGSCEGDYDFCRKERIKLIQVLPHLTDMINRHQIYKVNFQKFLKQM